MIRSLIAGVALIAVTDPALAFHCPGAMAKIDAALASHPALNDASLAEVKELRAEGESLHKAGKHYASLAALWTAEQLLGIEDDDSEKALHVGEY